MPLPPLSGHSSRLPPVANTSSRRCSRSQRPPGTPPPKSNSGSSEAVLPSFHDPRPGQHVVLFLQPSSIVRRHSLRLDIAGFSLWLRRSKLWHCRVVYLDLYASLSRRPNSLAFPCSCAVHVTRRS